MEDGHVLIDGHGNWGSMDDDPAAAMRYTEARLSPIAMELLRDIEKRTVLFKDNFDNTTKEPVVLPSRYPEFAGQRRQRDFFRLCDGNSAA